MNTPYSSNSGDASGFFSPLLIARDRPQNGGCFPVGKTWRSRDFKIGMVYMLYIYMGKWWLMATATWFFYGRYQLVLVKHKHECWSLVAPRMIQLFQVETPFLHFFLCVVYQCLHCYLVIWCYIIWYISDIQVLTSLPPAGFPLSCLFPHVHHNNQWIGLVEKIHIQFREMLVLLVPYVCIYIYSVYKNDGIYRDYWLYMARDYRMS